MVKAVLAVQRSHGAVAQVHALRVDHGIQAGRGHDVGGEDVGHRHRDRGDAGAQLDAQAGRVTEGGAIEAEHQLVAFPEDRRQHRLSLEHGGVNLEAAHSVDVDLGSLRQGEKAPEHEQRFLAAPC
jgi:hypothetical protein